LTGTLTDQCEGNGVSVALTPGLQNGSPDGLALVAPGNVVVEFLSYEGTFNATNGPAAGMTSVDIGRLEENASGTPSLQKDAAGWYGPVTSSFGACNVRPAAPPTSIFGRSPVDDVPLPVGYQDQLFATVNDVNGDPVVTPISWSSDTPLAEGTAIIRATGGNGTTGTLSLPTRIAVASTTAQYAGNAEFGEPTDSDASDDFIVQHTEYTASYNPVRGTPNWVSYEIDPSKTGATVSRSTRPCPAPSPVTPRLTTPARGHSTGTASTVATWPVRSTVPPAVSTTPAPSCSRTSSPRHPT
jgi:hypothetical protein